MHTSRLIERETYRIYGQEYYFSGVVRDNEGDYLFNFYPYHPVDAPANIVGPRCLTSSEVELLVKKQRY